MKEEQSRIFACFLKCVRNSVQNKYEPLPELSAEEWRRIFRLAEKQELLPLLCEEASADDRLCGNKDLTLYFSHAVKEVTHQIRQVSDFLHVYDILLQNGLRPLIIKGVAVRHLYPRPYHRPSVDEDILIKPEEFAYCHRLLIAYGMELMFPEQDIQKDHEISYVRRSSGLYIEVHKELFPETSGAYGHLNRHFAGVFDRAVQMQISDPMDTAVLLSPDRDESASQKKSERLVYTMEPADHLFYLVCHGFKHFLHGGIGIRPICDMAMIARTHGSQIDWTFFWQKCREIRAEQFVSAIFKIAEKYLGFEQLRQIGEVPQKLPDVDEKPLLADIMDAGLYGASSMSRLHSSNMTLRAVEEGQAAEQAMKKTGQRVGKSRAGRPVSSAGGTGMTGMRFALHSLFLPLHAMKGRYPYLKKAPVLLPLAWAQRAFGYLKEQKAGKGAGKGEGLLESVRIGEERIQLLKQYGIIR